MANGHLHFALFFSLAETKSGIAIFVGDGALDVPFAL